MQNSELGGKDYWFTAREGGQVILFSSTNDLLRRENEQHTN